MSRTGYALLSFTCFLVLLAAFGCSSTRNGRADADYYGIAAACEELLRSAPANATNIALDDPKIPPVIHGLKPQQIYLVGGPDFKDRLVIVRSGRPAVYEFWRRGCIPHPWILSAAGPGYEHFTNIWMLP